MSAEDWVEVDHRRVGAFRVRAGDLLHFEGLPGFPHARRFALLRHDRPDQLFSWLACVDDPDLAFVITDPCAFVPSYAPPIPKRVLDRLDAKCAEDVAVLTIANLVSEPPRLNLAAPLMLHLDSRRGMQEILEDPQLPLSQPLEPEAPSPPPEAAEAQIESKPHR